MLNNTTPELRIEKSMQRLQLTPSPDLLRQAKEVLEGRVKVAGENAWLKAENEAWDQELCPRQLLETISQLLGVSGAKRGPKAKGTVVVVKPKPSQVREASGDNSAGSPEPQQGVSGDDTNV